MEFYEGVLRNGEVLPSAGGLGEGMRQPSISADVYANVLTGDLSRCLTSIAKQDSVTWLRECGSPACPQACMPTSSQVLSGMSPLHAHAETAVTSFHEAAWQICKRLRQHPRGRTDP